MKPTQNIENELDRITRQAQNENLMWVGAVLKGAQNDRFYGEMTFIMQEGRVLRIEKKESLLPPKG